jgi:ADP-heptose:LPS heptosyltransferase
LRANRVLYWADRCIGIALLWLLRPFKRSRGWTALPREASIALLNFYGLGDTVLISAIVADLRAAFPHARLVFFAGPSSREAAGMIPGIRVVPVPLSPLGALRAIRREHFDLLIDCEQWLRMSALVCFFARAAFTAGFRARGQHRHALYDRAAPHGDAHELDNFRALLKVLGIAAGAPPTLHAPAAAGRPPYALLHMHAAGSRAHWKEWPADRWVALIDELTARGLDVLLTGSADERARCLAVRERCRAPRQVEVPAGRCTLAETAALLRGACGVVSVDTGVMHLAAALGCATIALHGPTSPQRWGGQGARVVSLVADPRGPFLHHGFESIAPPDMTAIAVADVLRHLLPECVRP